MPGRRQTGRLVLLLLALLGSSALAWPPREGRALLRWQLADALASLPLAAPPEVALVASGCLVAAVALACVWRARAWVAPAPDRVARADVAVLALALVLAVQVPCVQPLWRALEPRMLAVDSYHRMRALPWEARDAARDPWGTAWCRREGYLDSETWSAGPNRVDELMRGDDMVVNFGLGVLLRNLAYLDAPRLLLAASAGLLALWLALRLALLWRLPDASGDREQPPGNEAVSDLRSPAEVPVNGRVVLLLVLLLGAAGAWAWRAPALGGDGAPGGGAAGSLPHAWPPVRGQRYPDLELPNHRGKMVKLSSFEGKVIVVEPIGLACPACQAYAGAHDVGAFRGGRPQANLPSFARLLERYAGLDWTSEPDLVYVHLLLYDMSNARAPTREDGRAWAAHFGLDDAPNAVVLVGDARYVNRASYALVPGFQVIDRDFVLRYDGAGHHPADHPYDVALAGIPDLLAGR